MLGAARHLASLDLQHKREKLFRIKVKEAGQPDSYELILIDGESIKPIKLTHYVRQNTETKKAYMWFAGEPTQNMTLKFKSNLDSGKGSFVSYPVHIKGNALLDLFSDSISAVGQVLKLKRSGLLADLKLIRHDLRAILAGILSPIARRKIRTLEKNGLLEEFQDTWLFMDRPLFADDNAEHLYRYAREAFPDQKMHYILKSDSRDWKRLENDNFNLLEFGSEPWVAAVLASKCVFSSHMNMAATEPLPFYFNKFMSKKNIFLRHGVGISSNHGWLNRRKIDLMCVSSKWELTRLIDNDAFVFTDVDVKVTGLARFDSLLTRANSQTENQNLFLVMPTWRREFIQIDNSKRGDRSLDLEKFKNSLFYKNWIAFLMDPELKQISETHNVKFRVMLHANLRSLIDVLDLPDYIEFHHESGDTFQDALIKSKALITDYTSVHYDMAYINRPTFHLQFDRDLFYNNALSEHSLDFDHKREGFGPFAETPDELINNIKRFLAEGLDEMYLERMAEFFTYRDTQCRQRIMTEALKRI